MRFEVRTGICSQKLTISTLKRQTYSHLRLIIPSDHLQLDPRVTEKQCRKVKRSYNKITTIYTVLI